MANDKLSMLIVLPCIDTLLRFPPTGLNIDLELFYHACAFGGWHCLQNLLRSSWQESFGLHMT